MKKILSALVSICLLASVSATAFAAPGQNLAEKSGEGVVIYRNLDGKIISEQEAEALIEEARENNRANYGRRACPPHQFVNTVYKDYHNPDSSTNKCTIRKVLHKICRFCDATASEDISSSKHTALPSCYK